MPPVELDRSKIDFQRYYAYGFVLNVPPILITYPMRVVRILQQRKSAVPVSSSVYKVMQDVQRRNGFRALFAGATVYSAGLTSTKILQFATYDFLAQQIKEHDHFGVAVLKTPSVLSGFLGTFSAVITTLFIVPFDMISQQITIAKAAAHEPVAAVPMLAAGAQGALQTTPPMPISESLRAQFRQEGVRFLFRGYCATLMSTVPYFGAYFPAYEYTKGWIKEGIAFVQSQQHDQEHPFPHPRSHQVIISALSGSAAAFAGVMVSSPSDMVKTRIQTEQRLQPTNTTAAKTPLPSLKWRHVFVEIWKKEGFRAFFSGTRARVILSVPGGALNFVIFDFVRSVSFKDATPPPPLLERPDLRQEATY